MYDLLIVPLLLLGGSAMSDLTGNDVDLQMQLSPDTQGSYCWSPDGQRFDSWLELDSGKGWLGAQTVWFYDHTSCATESFDRFTSDTVGLRARWRF